MFSFLRKKKEEVVAVAVDEFPTFKEIIEEETPIPSLRGKRIVFNDKNQESRVLSIIKEKGLGMTPPEVHEDYEKLYDSVPLTSIRRALTKLTDHGYLNMTGEKRKGKYNRENFVWSLKNIENEQN
jgi:hypothetical protein